jgi:hypothetical protein
LGLNPASKIQKYHWNQQDMADREGLEPPLRLDDILGDLHDLPLHIKQPPPSIALKDLNLAPIQQEKFGRQFELDSMLGAFFTQSWLDGSSPGDDFVSIALPQRPACLILSPPRSGGIARGKPLSLCSFKLAKIAQRLDVGKANER